MARVEGDLRSNVAENRLAASKIPSIGAGTAPIWIDQRFPKYYSSALLTPLLGSGLAIRRYSSEMLTL